MLAVHHVPVYPILSLWILALTAATLFWVALTDLREFKVRNEFVAILITDVDCFCQVRAFIAEILAFSQNIKVSLITFKV